MKMMMRVTVLARADDAYEGFFFSYSSRSHYHSAPHVSSSDMRIENPTLSCVSDSSLHDFIRYLSFTAAIRNLSRSVLLQCDCMQ